MSSGGRYLTWGKGKQKALRYGKTIHHQPAQEGEQVPPEGMWDASCPSQGGPRGSSAATHRPFLGFHTYVTAFRQSSGPYRCMGKGRIPEVEKCMHPPALGSTLQILRLMTAHNKHQEQQQGSPLAPLHFFRHRVPCAAPVQWDDDD